MGEFTGRRTWGAVPVKSASNWSPLMVTASAMVWGSATPSISIASACPHRPERGEPELAREPLEPARADPARGHLGAEVADHLLAEPDVAADQREEILVGDAGAIEAQRRDDEALLEDLLAQPRALPPADV